MVSLISMFLTSRKVPLVTSVHNRRLSKLLEPRVSAGAGAGAGSGVN